MDAINKVVTQLTGCTVTRVIGKGTYGQVFSGISPTGKNVAVKITCAQKTGNGELYLWKQIQHPNILPLLDVVSLPQHNIFVMPLMSTDLLTMVEDPEFKALPSSWNLVNGWMKDIVSALSYLHGRKIAHLDVKADNVLISPDSRAIVADFTALSTASGPVTEYTLPRYLQPPETNEVQDAVDGPKFDMWAYGFLALNIFTGHSVAKHMTGLYFSWETDVYPLMFDVLQPTTFRRLVHHTFQAVQISKSECLNSLDFVLTSLKFNPCDRKPAEELMRHAYLGNGEFYNGCVDRQWVEKCQAQNEWRAAVENNDIGTLGNHSRDQPANELKKLNLLKRVRGWFKKRFSKRN